MERWNWSSATYRLDEITSRFPLPCVVQVMEGYLSETETESVSSGDIIKIDSEKTLNKVAANFAGRQPETGSEESLRNDYVYFTREEILVPLSYQGKLKVVQDEEEFTSVKELCKAWPRYAKLTETLSYQKSDGGVIRIPAGTVIELKREKNGMLKFSYDSSGRRKKVSAPLQTNGHFLSLPDDNEYTLEEALNRYKLPFIVSFTSDDIKQVYTRDVMEGISNMKTITATLRLNRRVTQKVLVGHYKPLEDVEETEDSRQRTLVVLPLDSSLVREIEVSVAEDVLEEDYVTVFQVYRNTDKDMEVVDGTLYVDLVSDTGMRRLEVLEEQPNVTPKPQTVLSDDNPSHQKTVHSGRRPPPPPSEVSNNVLMEEYEEVTQESVGQPPRWTELQKSSNPQEQPSPQSNAKTKDGKKKKNERKKGKNSNSSNNFSPRRPPPPTPTETPTCLTDYEDVTPTLPSRPTRNKTEYQHAPNLSPQPIPESIGFSLSEINFSTAATTTKPEKEYSNTGFDQGHKKKHRFNIFGKSKENHDYYNTSKSSKHVRIGNRPEMPLPDIPRKGQGINSYGEIRMKLPQYEGIDVDGENMLQRYEDINMTGANMLQNYEDIGEGGENLLQRYEEISIRDENTLQKYEDINVGDENLLNQHEGIGESGLALYDQIDESCDIATNVSNQNNLNKASPRQLVQAADRQVTSESPRSLTASAQGETNAVKPFYSLTMTELEERLTICGLQELAEVCREENIDGNFFEDLSDEFLQQSPFNLDGFKLKKFRRVKGGWVPK